MYHKTSNQMTGNEEMKDKCDYPIFHQAPHISQ